MIVIREFWNFLVIVVVVIFVLLDYFNVGVGFNVDDLFGGEGCY